MKIDYELYGNSLLLFYICLEKYLICKHLYDKGLC